MYMRENAPKITTVDELRTAIKEIVDHADFNSIGDVKAHMKAKLAADGKTPVLMADGTPERVDSGESFLTAQIRLPTSQAVTIAGEKVYSNHFVVKLDAFKLTAEPNGTTSRAAKPATANADALKSRLASKVVVVNPAKPAATDGITDEEIPV